MWRKTRTLFSHPLLFVTFFIVDPSSYFNRIYFLFAVCRIGNAYSDDQVVPFYAPANVYGEYTDPYLANKTNPDRMVLTSDGQPVTNWTEGGSENVIIPLRWKQRNQTWTNERQMKHWRVPSNSNGHRLPIHWCNWTKPGTFTWVQKKTLEFVQTWLSVMGIYPILSSQIRVLGRVSPLRPSPGFGGAGRN